MDRDAGVRPVALISREHAIQIRDLVCVVPLSTHIRNLPSEVKVGPNEGVPKTSVINCDVIKTIDKKALKERITRLNQEKLKELNATLQFSLGLD